MTDGFSIVRPDAVSTERFDTCETSVRKLTEPLDCTEMRLNQVVVDPGEVTTPRTHDDQEEVFVAMTDGQIAIEGDVHDVPNGGIVRVPPEAIRNLLNRTGIFSTAPESSQPHRNLLNRTEDSTHVWLAIGAPPVGTVDDFGAYVVSDEG